MAILGGAVEGLVLDQHRTRQGDAFDWERIEACAELAIVPGLASGLAVILSRRLIPRILLAAVFGIALGLLQSALYGSTLFPLRSTDWRDLLTHPIGIAGLLVAPTSGAIALSVHLFRTCRTNKGMVLSWMVSAVVGFHCQNVFWFATDAAVFKNPWDALTLSSVLSSRGFAGLGFTMCAGIGVLCLELASMKLHRGITAAATAVAVAIVAGMYWATQAMPFTSPSSIESIAFSPDGDTVVTTHRGHAVRLWRIPEEDEGDAEEIRKVRSPGEYRKSLSCATNGRQILGTNYTDKVTLWDAEALKPSAEVHYSKCRFGAPAISRNGTSLAVQDYETGDIWLWAGVDVRWPFRTAPLILMSRGARLLAFSPNERTLIATDREGGLRAWDIFSGTVVAEYEGREGDGWIDWERPDSVQARSPNGKRVAVGGPDGRVRILRAPPFDDD